MTMLDGMVWRLDSQAFMNFMNFRAHVKKIPNPKPRTSLANPKPANPQIPTFGALQVSSCGERQQTGELLLEAPAGRSLA